jgi:hypothetical protein
VVVAKRIGTHRAQAEENKYGPAVHRLSQPQGARLRKLCQLCGAHDPLREMPQDGFGCLITKWFDRARIEAIHRGVS